MLILVKKEIKTFYIENEKTFFENKTLYDNELKELYTNINYSVTLGKFPGSGKSWACSLVGKHILYVTPYNELCLELIAKGYTAITLHNLMSLNFSGNNNSKKKRFDVTSFDTIVFEEILLYSPKLLSSIERFIKLHPDKKILANGDVSQNLPILNDDLNNISTQDKYLMECINAIFPNRIILEVNKRLEDPKDREILKELKEDVFDVNKDIIKTFEKYNFNMIDTIHKLKTTKNISYFKSRSYKINKYVQDNLITTPNAFIEYEHECNGNMYMFKYYVGQQIKCRQSFRRKNVKLYTNYVYEIVNIDNENNLTIKNTINDEIAIIQYEHLKYMSLPFSSTCHSLQGVTIHKEFTIFDCNIAYADRRFIWTALTRATSFKNVTIFKHSDKECKALERCKIKQYYELKIQNYIQQDILSGRIKKENDTLYCKNVVIDDYINYEWFMDQEFKCYLCGCNFYFELEDGRVNSNISADRVDCSLPHTINNCKICCYQCNRCKTNK